MKTSFAKVRYGKIITDIVYSRSGATRAIIFGYGLLGSPQRRDSPTIKKFVSNGFAVFLPRYLGTYESDGVCTFENAADSLLETVKLVKRGTARDVRSSRVVKWKAKQIILAGGSFGAAAALVAGAKSDVDKIIAVAGPVDWRIKRGVGAYRLMWSMAYRNTWRCSKNAWKKLISGNLDLNAIDYADVLKKKDVMLVHGSRDFIVSPEHSKSLFKKLEGGNGKHELVIINGADHSDVIGLLAMPKVFKRIVKWLK